MALSKAQLDQLGFQFFNANGTLYGVDPSKGILQKLDSNTANYIQSIGGTVQNVGTGVDSPLQRYNTVGGSTITLNTLTESLRQAQQRIDVQAEEQRVQQLNQAIKAGDTATVERLAPDYTIWNGAFVQKSTIPQLQAEGATVQGGNVVGPSVPGLGGTPGTPPQLADLGKQALDSMYGKGYVLNKNADLNDPRTFAEFLRIAQDEISPFFKNRFSDFPGSVPGSSKNHQRYFLQNAPGYLYAWTRESKNVRS